MRGALDEAWTMEGTVGIPLLGEVAAGKPIEMFSVEETLDVPGSMWHGRKVFALRVRGQSMIDAGIHDGDYLIVEPTENADDGRTVVAEVDGQVTVKKLFRAPGGRCGCSRRTRDAALIISGDSADPRSRRRRAAQVRSVRPRRSAARAATGGDGASRAPAGTGGRNPGSVPERHRRAARTLAHRRRAPAIAQCARARPTRAARARPAGAARMVCAHDQARAAPRPARRREPHHPAHAASRRAQRTGDDRSAPTGLTYPPYPAHPHPGPLLPPSGPGPTSVRAARR